MNFFGRFFGAFLHGGEKNLLGAFGNRWMFVNRDDKGKRKGWVVVLHAVSTCGDRLKSLTSFIISPNHLTTYYAAKILHH